MADANAALIEKLYSALDRHDGDAMAACYAPEASFRDPAFGDLHGDEVGAMWRMLTSRAEDLDVELQSHEADEQTGTARWIAHYTFTQTGRHVTNDVRATFSFQDGLIVDHVDQFDFGRWSRQALGPMGLVLGWTPLLPAMTRRKALEQLDEFSAAS